MSQPAEQLTVSRETEDGRVDQVSRETAFDTPIAHEALQAVHVLDDRQYRDYQACPQPGRGGSASAYWRACAELRDPARTLLGAGQEAWLAEGMQGSKARWNIIAQQTLMAQNSQVPVHNGDDGRFWTDGWDGYPAARTRLLSPAAMVKRLPERLKLLAGGARDVPERQQTIRNAIAWSYDLSAAW